MASARLLNKVPNFFSCLLSSPFKLRYCLSLGHRTLLEGRALLLQRFHCSFLFLQLRHLLKHLFLLGFELVGEREQLFLQLFDLQFALFAGLGRGVYIVLE